MDAIRLSSSGLQTLAMQHGAAAGEVARGVPASGVASGGQATSVAVRFANTLVTATASQLAKRLSATGMKVSAISTVMTEQDHESADQLSALSPIAGV